MPIPHCMALEKLQLIPFISFFDDGHWKQLFSLFTFDFYYLI